MKIAIVGAGAVGSGYGGLLASAGAEVTLVDVWPEHVAAIARDGLVVDGRNGAVRVAASSDPAGVDGAGAVLVLTKSFATAAAAAALAPHLANDAVAVTLQNGLGNDRALADAVGADRVVAGSTTFGAELLGPGHVRLAPSAADGRSLTSLGAPPAGSAASRRVQELARALEAAGLPVEVRGDVDAVIWRKLAMTASIGPLCALLRRTVADVLAHGPTRSVLMRMFDEIVAVAHARGVALDAAELWDHALATWEGIGAHPPSIAVDVAAGRRTEIDALCGAVARLGDDAGVAAPVNAVVAAAIRAGEPAR
jgi:2-dehydropantoate 2-reductase